MKRPCSVGELVTFIAIACIVGLLMYPKLPNHDFHVGSVAGVVGGAIATWFAWSKRQ